MRHGDRKLVILALAAATLPVRADTLILRSGKQVNGTLLGATARQVEFLPNSGEALKLPLESVQSINLSQLSTPAESAPPKSRKTVRIPTGTTFRIRTVDLIDVDSTQAGAKFRGTLDDPIMLGGDVIVPRGADVALVAAKVQQGGRVKGSDLVELKVNAISERGRSYPVVTSVSQSKSAGEGKKSTGKILGGAGLGAIIGGIAGGGKGAGIGALVGGAGGTVLTLTSQPHLKVPPESRLEFQLLSDWTVQ
jgi:hypothetical protein